MHAHLKWPCLLVWFLVYCLSLVLFFCLFLEGCWRCGGRADLGWSPLQALQTADRELQFFSMTSRWWCCTKTKPGYSLSALGMICCGVGAGGAGVYSLNPRISGRGREKTGENTAEASSLEKTLLISVLLRASVLNRSQARLTLPLQSCFLLWKTGKLWLWLHFPMFLVTKVTLLWSSW